MNTRNFYNQKTTRARVLAMKGFCVFISFFLMQAAHPFYKKAVIDLESQDFKVAVISTFDEKLRLFGEALGPYLYDVVDVPEIDNSVLSIDQYITESIVNKLSLLSTVQIKDLSLSDEELELFFDARTLLSNSSQRKQKFQDLLTENTDLASKLESSGVDVLLIVSPASHVIDQRGVALNSVGVFFTPPYMTAFSLVYLSVFDLKDKGYLGWNKFITLGPTIGIRYDMSEDDIEKFKKKYYEDNVDSDNYYRIKKEYKRTEKLHCGNEVRFSRFSDENIKLVVTDIKRSIDETMDRFESIYIKKKRHKRKKFKKLKACWD